MASTQNTNTATVFQGSNSPKITQQQQNQWSSMIVARMTQNMQSKSVNQVLWKDDQKKK